MRLVSIASGSSGNCIYIGSERTHIPVSYTHLRKVKLSNYYSEKNYSDVELMFLVKLLQKKLDKNKTNIWYMFLVIGSLLFPVWNTFIERWLRDTPSMTIFFSIMVRVLAIAIVIPFVYLFSIPVNYVLTFNQRIAENIVYLTQFILSERGHNES